MERFLSVDPGLEDTGWAVIESNGKGIRVKGFGLIKTKNNTLVQSRLSKIYDEISKIIENYSITQGAIEGMFFSNKIKAQTLSLYAKGVIMLAFEKHCICCSEYNPVTVKKMITGNGKANKSYVKRVIKAMFSINEKLYHDVSDAIAIGIAAARLHFLKVKRVL
ncbi:MAG: crossover junction endodeoxyribonuclease RuvC [Elusimicrobiales bacterium]